MSCEDGPGTEIRADGFRFTATSSGSVLEGFYLYDTNRIVTIEIEPNTTNIAIKRCFIYPRQESSGGTDCSAPRKLDTISQMVMG